MQAMLQNAVHSAGCSGHYGPFLSERDGAGGRTSTVRPQRTCRHVHERISPHLKIFSPQQLLRKKLQTIWRPPSFQLTSAS